eukprot:TRINITY_DN16706_c0_g1_i1.p5 TRINITY_DN16706_c0_g1~~TRINITY_DN16706_c0_g1_i1.p5  ORF type:complete len:106 (-),score=48.87 TRINITY_DN16706_c0_g1_i1:1299-1616(-)
MFFFFFFKQKTAYEMLRSLVGSEMCIRDSHLLPQCFSAIVDCVAEGFVQYSLGNVSVAPIQTMGQPPLAPWTAALRDSSNAGSQMCIKSGYVKGDEHMVVKIAPG